MPKVSAVRLSVLLMALFVVAGCRRGEVARVVDGEVVSGRFIHPASYAAYARGAFAEADGQDLAAREHYLEAASLDAHGVQIWTRLGAVLCRLGDRRASDRAFERAVALEANYQPVYGARARCALRQGRVEQALKDSERAIALDPLDDASVGLLIESARRGGGKIDTTAWSRERRTMAPFGGTSEERTSEKTFEQRIDEALLARKIALAQQLARKAHLDPRRLGTRALLLGRAEVAVVLARRRLRADPHDSDNRILLALAADLAGRPEDFADSWKRVPRQPRGLSLRGRLMMVEILLRHGGLRAAKPWLRSLSKDRLAILAVPLARRLLVRLDMPEPVARRDDD